MLLGPVLAAWLGRHLFERTGQSPPKPSPSDQEAPSIPLTRFAGRESHLIMLILIGIALAFGLQKLLLAWFSGLSPDHVPVIVLSNLMGGIIRFAYEIAAGPDSFPEKELTVLLLGPTIGIVLAYAVLSVPFLTRITPLMAVAGGFTVITSALFAWVLHPLFARLSGRYYAVVIAIASLGVTTGWGPVAMAFLRRFTDESGPVEPIPAILLLNAFYLFPWTAIALTQLVFALAG